MRRMQVRRGALLEPTARARQLAPQLADALGRMRQLLRPARFDPGAEQRVFRLAMSDYGAAVLLPALLPVLRAEAPQVDLVVSQASREAMTAQVQDGEIDLAFGVFPQLPAALVAQRLFAEEFVCVADRASLGGGAALGLAAWLARPHVLLSLWADSGNEVDLALAQAGARRRVCLTLPHWGVAPALVKGSDLVLTVARRMVPAGAVDQALAVFAPPFAIAPFAFCQLWHRRREDDMAHRWLRQRIAALAGAQ
ncbi:LysR family transcriptional regulator [Massilia atriviolacea]|nr:LysR substrate-binding domain-containing protein [Massilia atriviolacea]